MRRIGSAEVTGPIPVSSSEERACEIEEISHAFLIHRKLRSLLNKNAPLWMRTPRLRKLVADATALRRERAQERTLFLQNFY